MKNDRRQFLKLTAVAATGLVLPLYSCGNNSESSEQQESLDVPEEQALAKGTPLSEFGIQLYTLKEAMAEDPKNVLKQLSTYGYKQIEGFEGQKGLFWGMKNTEFKKYINDLGMTFVSSHINNFNETIEEKAQKAGEIGMKYLICPWVGPQESIENFKRIAEQFNEAGAICKKHNLRFAYHNHAYSFELLEGEMPQKVLIENTDPELVDYEMDIFWVAAAGEDPQEHLKQYSDRYKLVHVKDRSKNPAEEGKPESTILGTGSIDYDPILKTAKETGVNYYFLEQEQFAGTEPFESSRKGAEYLKNLEI